MVKLTKTEMSVVRLAFQGLSNKGIGEQLYIARSTVENHLRHIYLKLGIEGRNKRIELLRGWKHLIDEPELPMAVDNNYLQFLRPREIRTLELLSLGKNCAEISNALRVKLTTAQAYRVEIYRAMALTGMQQFNKAALVMRLNDVR